MIVLSRSFFFFFFNDTATTEIYTLSLHDALPIYQWGEDSAGPFSLSGGVGLESAESRMASRAVGQSLRSEEHTSELQSPDHLVCRLLLEKKKTAPHRLTESAECTHGPTLPLQLAA